MTAFHRLRETAIRQAIASGTAVLAINRIADHTNPLITLNLFSHVLKDPIRLIQKALDESYAELNSGGYAADRNLLTT